MPGHVRTPIPTPVSMPCPTTDTIAAERPAALSPALHFEDPKTSDQNTGNGALQKPVLRDAHAPCSTSHDILQRPDHNVSTKPVAIKRPFFADLDAVFGAFKHAGRSAQAPRGTEPESGCRARPGILPSIRHHRSKSPRDALNKSSRRPYSRTGSIRSLASAVNGTTIDSTCRLLLLPGPGRAHPPHLFRTSLAGTTTFPGCNRRTKVLRTSAGSDQKGRMTPKRSSSGCSRCQSKKGPGSSLRPGATSL